MASDGPLPRSAAARSNTSQCGAMPPSVPPDMTRQIRLASLAGRWRSNSRQGERRVPAREIVDESIALGLGEDREHALGVDAPRCDGGLDAADVIGRRGRDAMDQSAVGHDPPWASRTIKRAAIM